MSGTNQNPIARRRRPQAVVSGDSGFVLILVLPVAMMLMMTALSLVLRSNSAAVASAQESRAQAARMAAEYGFNQFMALVNIESDYSQSPKLIVPQGRLTPDTTIADSPAATYTITLNGPLPTFSTPLPLTESCDNTEANNQDLSVTVLGKIKTGSKTYKREINRTLRVCALVDTSNIIRLKVRAIK